MALAMAVLMESMDKAILLMVTGRVVGMKKRSKRT